LLAKLEALGSVAAETMMFSSAAFERLYSRTLPFAKNANSSSKATYPELSVEQYAAFAAQMQVNGASSAILARYGITSTQTMLALHRQQERRLAASPEMRARFEERKAHSSAS